MSSITANELKTKGVSAVEQLIQEQGEVFVSVRGINKYVMLDAKRYAQYREFELTQALAEAKTDMQQGNVSGGSIEQHMQRILQDVPADLP